MARPRTLYARSDDVHVAYHVIAVTRTVRDLVAGSGIVFDDRGVHDLKGVPEQWSLYAASG